MPPKSKKDAVSIDIAPNRREPPKRGISARAIYYVRNDLVGIATDEEMRKADVPDDCKILHTKTGQPYVRRKKAPKERVGTSLSVFTSSKTLAEKFGEGIFQYFFFLKYLCGINFVLAIFGLANAIPHWVKDGWITQVSGFNNTECTDGAFNLNLTEQVAVQLSNFYIISYRQNTYQIWWWTNLVAAIICLFVFAPLLSSRIRKRFKRNGVFDHQDRYKKANDVIRGKDGKALNPRGTKWCRIIFSYFLFIALILVFGIITLGFVMAQLYVFNKSFESSLLVGMVTIILDTIGQFVWTFLTKMERHRRWTSFNKHHIAKFYLSKLTNISIMLLSYWLVREGYLTNASLWSWIRPSTSYEEEEIKCIAQYNPKACEVSAVGNTLLSIILIEITAGNIIEVLYPWAYYKFMGCCCRKKTSKKSDVGRVEFEVADEYLELYIRQFIVYIGMPIVPIIPVFAFIANLLEILVDRYRLMRLTKTPPYLRGSMRHFLVFFMFLTSIVSILVFPYGSFWVLSSFFLSKSCPETILANPKIV